MPFFENRKLPYSSELSSYLAEIPWSGNKTTFLLSKQVEVVVIPNFA